MSSWRKLNIWRITLVTQRSRKTAKVDHSASYKLCPKPRAKYMQEDMEGRWRSGNDHTASIITLLGLHWVTFALETLAMFHPATTYSLSLFRLECILSLPWTLIALCFLWQTETPL